MNPKDKLILSYLRQDARIQLTKMSKKTKIPVSTLFEKLKSYKQGVVKKHTSIIDFNKLGYNSRAKVLLKAKKSELPKLREHLLKNPNTNELYKVNNGYDFLAEFIYHSMPELEKYLDYLGTRFEVKKTRALYVVEELKREEFMSKPHLLKLGT